MLPLKKYKGLYKPAGTPEIDWNDPRTYGLRGCFVPDGNSVPFDLLGITPPLNTFGNTSSPFTSGDTPAGRGAKFSAVPATSQGVRTAVLGECIANKSRYHFAMVVAHMPANLSAAGGLFQFVSSINTNGRWGISMNAPNSPRMTYISNGGTNQGLTSSATVTAGKPFVIAVALNQVTGSASIYVNGVKTTGTIAVETQSINTIVIGNIWNGGVNSLSFEGTILLCSYYNYIPDDAIIYDLMNDPFGFLTYPEDDQILLPAVGGIPAAYNNHLWFGTDF